MSATLDAAMFAAYFGGGGGSGDVTTLAAGGRTFPVQQALDTALPAGFFMLLATAGSTARGQNFKLTASSLVD